MKQLPRIVLAMSLVIVLSSSVLADKPVKTKVSPLTITVRANNVKIRLDNAQFARPTADHPIELPFHEDRKSQIMWYTFTDTTLGVQTAGAVETKLLVNVESEDDTLNVQADSSEPKKLGDNNPILKFDSAGHGEIHDTENAPQPISVKLETAK